MTKKRTVRDTGIYITTKGGETTDEDLARLLDIDQIMANAHQYAQQLIDLHEADNWPWPKMPEEIRRAAVEDAHELLSNVYCLGGFQKDKKALAWAFHAGQLYERLIVTIGVERLVKLQRGTKAREARDEQTNKRYRQALKMLKAFCERDGVDPEMRKGITKAKEDTVDALRLPPSKRAKKYPFLSDELKKVRRTKTPI